MAMHTLVENKGELYLAGALLFAYYTNGECHAIKSTNLDPLYEALVGAYQDSDLLQDGDTIHWNGARVASVQHGQIVM